MDIIKNNNQFFDDYKLKISVILSGVSIKSRYVHIKD